MSVSLQPHPWETTLLDWAYAPLAASPCARMLKADAQVLRAAYAVCDDITRESSRTFFLASGLLPPDKRHAARALYAFCRVTDNLVDAPDTSVAERQAALDRWRALALDHNPPHDAPVALAWADTRARFHIPAGYAEQLIDGVAQDLDKTRYDSFEELAAYAYGVASTVGLMAMHIIGFTGEQAIPYAIKLGVALQVTNILRDVGEDWANGRLYLPLEELQAFGLSEANIASGRVCNRWRAFIRSQIARTNALYEEALPGIAHLNPDGRFAITAAAQLYRAIMDDIERRDYDVFRGRARIGALGKLSRLPGIWWRSKSL
ncbi:MAG: squalene/phytoene synthase family protein [Anaerolineae bacterium]|nr:squalene/phytoene synthase family protein [Anaerolineae bacterium]